MPVTFKNTKIANLEKPQVVEDAFRAYYNFSGIHDFSFDTLYSNSSLVYNAPSGSGWKISINEDVVMPRQHIVKYSINAYGHGIAFAMDKYGNYPGYVIGVNASGYPEVRRTDGVTLLSHPTTVPQNANVTASMRLIAFTSQYNAFWLGLSLFINGAHVITYIDYVGSPTHEYYFGVAAIASTTRTFSNISIPQLTEFIEWNSLDPGEYPSGGLNRAIDGRYLKYFMRYNGVLRAWRPKERASVDSFDSTNDIIAMQKSNDNRNSFSHIRMVGAYKEAEYVNPTAKFYRFQEVENPYLMTVDDCYREAKAVSKMMQESEQSMSIIVPSKPLLELEDRVTIDGVDWIVQAISYGVKPNENETKIELRKYVGYE